MKRDILAYGLFGGVLIALLKLIEYRFLIVEHSVQIYGGLIAAVFAGLGVWLGLRLAKAPAPARALVREVRAPADTPFLLNETLRVHLGIPPASCRSSS